MKLMPVICQGSDRPQTGHGAGSSISNILKLFLEMTIHRKIFYYMILIEKNAQVCRKLMPVICQFSDRPRTGHGAGLLHQENYFWE
jgi:hypothetical protein